MIILKFSSKYNLGSLNNFKEIFFTLFVFEKYYCDYYIDHGVWIVEYGGGTIHINTGRNVRETLT